LDWSTRAPVVLAEGYLMTTVSQINDAVRADLERVLSMMDRSDASLSDEDMDGMLREIERIERAMEARGIREGTA
jgi:hypothetical protein